MLTYRYPPSPPLSMPKPTTQIDSNSSYLNLERVVQVYGNQPELLELILSSKVEEDRRRAEEAKLRRKEIDYMLQQKKKLNATVLPPIIPADKRSNSIEMLLSPDSALPK